METNKPILVTGAAGFIGFHIARRLLEEGFSVCGLDNLNAYYDVSLKKARLRQLEGNARFRFFQVDIADAESLAALWQTERFEAVVHLAAQAGVRYSASHPHLYLRSNVDGFLNLLECCRRVERPYLVYASSSSVYGANTKIPFCESDCAEFPKSLYGATKKMNELMAHAHAQLYGIQSVGLRYFTVYGPWGRPDMAVFLFSEAQRKGRPIDVFHHGNMERSFTFIDDVVEATMRVVLRRPAEAYKIYNVGNPETVPLMKAIEILEQGWGKRFEKRFCDSHAGEVVVTCADMRAFQNDFGVLPFTALETGIGRFIEWYRDYYG